MCMYVMKQYLTCSDAHIRGIAAVDAIPELGSLEGVSLQLIEAFEFDSAYVCCSSNILADAMLLADAMILRVHVRRVAPPAQHLPVMLDRPLTASAHGLHVSHLSDHLNASSLRKIHYSCQTLSSSGNMIALHPVARHDRLATAVIQA